MPREASAELLTLALPDIARYSGLSFSLQGSRMMKGVG